MNKTPISHPEPDVVVARAFRELLQAIEATAGGAVVQSRLGYERLFRETWGLQERPRNLGFWLSYWMDRWRDGLITVEDLGQMNVIREMLMRAVER